MKGKYNVLEPVLSKRNAHVRDANIVFEEEGHKYTILNDSCSLYTSVTTWNHSHFPHFDADAIVVKMMSGKNWNPSNKYWGKTAEEIKQGWTDAGAAVSGAGTDLHFDIECFMNRSSLDFSYTHKDLLENHVGMNDSVEWQFFLQFVRDFPDMKPYRTEWMIYDQELKLAGSIDMVYENEDGTLSIYDWKRSKEIKKVNGFGKSAVTECIEYLPDTNYWHYSLQLNTYKAILEAQYGKKVKDLYLVRLHPTMKTYELIKCADLSKEVADLFVLRTKK
jgi:ATP-dependent exoDNAse (exonuclease V) beta subunit